MCSRVIAMLLGATVGALLLLHVAVVAPLVLAAGDPRRGVHRRPPRIAGAARVQLSEDDLGLLEARAVSAG